MARVKSIMLADVPTLKKEAMIGEAAKLLAKNESGCVVVTESNKPIGIVTELDFVKNISKSGGLKEPVSTIMTSPLSVMSTNTKLDEALKIIDTKRFRRYPVVENDMLVGRVLSRKMLAVRAWSLILPAASMAQRYTVFASSMGFSKV